jgi:hypothetical protein
MSLRVLLSLAATLAFFAIPRTSSAQFYYSPTVVYYIPVDGHVMVTNEIPRAQHDDRIDPHLLKAARIAESRSSAHTSYRCWRSVKDALLEAGAVAARPTTSYACDAADELTSRYGFVRLPIRNPYYAPVGSVLVYSGNGAGHVEFRTEHGFASDYHSPWACRFHLIGVYAKLSA